MTGTKLIKDFVADVLLSGAAALAAIQVVDIQQVAEQPTVVAFALGGAVIRAAYRVVLRWATT